MEITSEQWSEIANNLEQHHAIFYKLWHIGKPIFKEEIETAAIEFDKEGNFIQFSFNPYFWKKLSLDGKLFVICHEMLHVILNHGKRSKNTNKNQKISANICLDLVVNHSLVENFGFEKEKIELSVRTALEEKEQKNILCWVDNIFPEDLTPTDECFEFYFQKYINQFKDGHCNQTNRINQGCIDDHKNLNDFDSEKILEEVLSTLSHNEIESLKGFAYKHELNSKAGTGTGIWHKINTRKIIKKKKWESIIKNWEKNKIKDTYGFAEQWLRKSRRYSCIQNELFLPTEIETHQNTIEENKINVFFFMDTSGSCSYFNERFFKCANSLDRNKFNIRLFCFDTKIEEIKLKAEKIYGGGGTLFSIIQKYVDNEIASKKIKYPHVFVLTDGFGDYISVKKPKKWYWFLTAGGTNIWIDKKCNIFNLSDYE